MCYVIERLAFSFFFFVYYYRVVGVLYGVLQRKAAMYVTFGISGKCWLLVYCLFFLSDLPLGVFCLLRTLLIFFY